MLVAGALAAGGHGAAATTADGPDGGPPGGADGAAEVWDLGRTVEVHGSEVRVDVGRVVPVAGIDLTWRGEPPTSVDIEYSTAVDDSDRVVAVADVPVSTGETFSLDLPELVHARFVTVVVDGADAVDAV
ncbi:hypothetical protein, partial [Phytoactinopolyspora endophytica]|uniref:hypothetical protein n=1 Tax=Phytoactinopolyspora endophytica TaxID=1642495 RepID=UPI001F0E1785